MSCSGTLVHRGQSKARRVGFRIKKALLATGGRRDMAWKLAQKSAAFLKPTTLYQLTGALPFLPASNTGLKFRPYRPHIAEPETFYREPQSIHGPPTWNIFPVRVRNRSELITVQGGIVNRAGHVFDADGLHIRRADHKKRYYSEPGWVRRPWRPLRKISRRDGVVAALTSSTQWNYYHWLFDVLPRLAMLFDSGEHFDLMYLQRATPFQDQTLDLIGVDGGRVVNCDDIPIIQADRLVVPCHQSTGRKEYPLWISERLRSWFLPPAGEPGGGRRIYVSRAPESRRGIVNEDEIVSYLAELGFERVLPENLSFLDQVRTFRDAEVVVAAHGAGLANIVFCNPGVKIIELFPPDTKYTYYKITRTLDLYYYFLRAAGAQNKVMKREDYTISVDSLRKTLELAAVGPTAADIRA